MSGLSKTKNIDLTTGNLFWKIIRFALPMMFASAMQMLYVTIDLATVHYGDSADAMGSIASTNVLINLIIVVFTGMSVGVNVVISEAKGANNKEKAEKVLHSSLIFALVTGVFVGILGFFISDDILKAIGTEEHYFANSVLYLRIYFCGLPFLMLYNYLAQILRGQGDSRTPLIALIIAGLVNVGVDCLFVIVFKMSVAGVAIATIISEAISVIICFLFLQLGKNNYVSFSFKKLHLNWVVLGDMIRIGLPAGLQGLFFSLPNLFVQASLFTIAPGNANIENGALAAGNIEGYVFIIIDAIQASVMTCIATNLGAKNKENIRKSIAIGLIWGTIACVLIVAITALIYRQLLLIYVDNEEAIAAGWVRLRIMVYFYIFNMTMSISSSTLRGLKYSLFPMISILLFCTIFRIIFLQTLFKLDYFHTLFWLYLIYPISWLLSTISNVIGIIILYPRKMKQIDREISLEN